MKKRNLRHEKMQCPTSTACRLCGVNFEHNIAGVCPTKLARVLDLPVDEHGEFYYVDKDQTEVLSHAPIVGNPRYTLMERRPSTDLEVVLLRERNEARSEAALWRTRHLGAEPWRAIDLFPWERET